MSGVATAIAVGSAVSAGASMYGANKAAKAAGNVQSINPRHAQDIAREISIDNAKRSILLEQELTPEVALLRSESIKRLLGDVSGEDAYSNAARDRLSAMLGGDRGGDIGLLRDAAQQAQADLALGGELPLDVRNRVARAAASNAASVGGGGLGMGRDISARDLGLTSLDLRQQRLTNALSSGNAYFEAGQGLFANDLNAAGAMSTLGNQGFSRRLAIAGLGQSIERPEVGLSAGSVVDLMTGNANSQNAANQQKAALQAQQWNAIGQLGGSLAGAGAAYLGNRSNNNAGIGQQMTYSQFQNQYGTT